VVFKLAVGNNTFLYFSTLGSATAPDRVTAVGNFTVDPSSGALIAVNEGTGAGEDTHLNDAAGGGGSNFTDAGGNVVGKVYCPSSEILGQMAA
jgi:hypothetical protein